MNRHQKYLNNVHELYLQLARIKRQYKKRGVVFTKRKRVVQ